MAESLYDLPPTLEMESRVSEEKVNDGYEPVVTASAEAPPDQSSTPDVSKRKTHCCVVVCLVAQLFLLVICIGAIAYGAFTIFKMQNDINALKVQTVEKDKTNETFPSANFSEELQSFKIENETESLKEGLNKTLLHVMSIANEVETSNAVSSQINQTLSELQAALEMKVTQIMEVIYKATGWYLYNGTIYKLFKTGKNGTEARDECEKLTAALAFTDTTVDRGVASHVMGSDDVAWIAPSNIGVNCNTIDNNGIPNKEANCNQTIPYICEIKA